MNAKNAIITQKTGSDGSNSIKTSLGGGLEHLLDLGGAHVLAEQLADDRARGLRRDLVDARQGLGLGGGDARFRVGELGREVPLDASSLLVGLGSEFLAHVLGH